jgi:hypothetical protein
MALDVNNSTLPPSAIFTVLAYAKLISDCFFTFNMALSCTLDVVSGCASMGRFLVDMLPAEPAVAGGSNGAAPGDGSKAEEPEVVGSKVLDDEEEEEPGEGSGKLALEVKRLARGCCGSRVAAGRRLQRSTRSSAGPPHECSALLSPWRRSRPGRPAGRPLPTTPRCAAL